MMREEQKTQIILDNGLELDLRTDIGFALTYQIDDIRNPATSNASFSKTIKLPGTANNNNILGGLFNINADFTIFNPNIKTFATIYQNYVVVMKGYFQLKNIDKEIQVDEEGNNITYNIVFFENSVDIFSQIKGEYIIGNTDATKDLDFSDLDHTLTLDTIQSSWTSLQDYLYPVLYPPNNNFAYNLSHMSPAIYHKVYLERIFDLEGYTLGGSFIDSNPRYDLEIIPYNGKNPLVDEEELTTREFRASYLGASAYAPFYVPQNSTNILDRYKVLGVNFADDSTLPNFDNDNNWNTTTQTYTVKKNGLYDLSVDMSGTISTYAVDEVDCYYIDPTVSIANQDLFYTSAYGTPPQARIMLQCNINGTPYGPQLSSGFFDLYPRVDIRPQKNLRGYSNLNNYRTSVNWDIAGNILSNVVLRTGDEVTFILKINTTDTFNTPQFYSSLDVGTQALPFWINTQRAIEYTFSVDNTSYLFNNAVEGLIFGGDTVYMNDYIPEKVKKEDILKDVITRYNLFMSVDPNNNKKILLDSRDDYYAQSGELDWTYKKDYSKEDKIEILSELQNKELLFTYTPDSDDANKNYTQSTKDIYGQKTISYTNEFVSGTKKIQSPFSPTPLIEKKGNGGKSFFVSYIETPEPRNKIRVLNFGGPRQMNSGTWSLDDGNQIRTYSWYPYTGHLDAPINPTYDINFGINSFYNFEGITIPSDNLYNTYWANYVDYVSDGRLVTSYFNLTETDINAVKDALFTKIFVKDSWYWINKIVDFNPMGSGLTKVELLKIKYL